MGFLDSGNKKHQGQHRQEHLRLLSNDGDCVTFHRLTAYHLFLGSHFDGTLASRGARHGSELFFTRHWTEFIGNMPPPTTTRAFFGYLVVFSTKSSGEVHHFSHGWQGDDGLRICGKVLLKHVPTTYKASRNCGQHLESTPWTGKGDKSHLKRCLMSRRE